MTITFYLYIFGHAIQYRIESIYRNNYLEHMSGISWDMELNDDMDDYWVNIYRDSFTVDESVAYHPETWDTMIIGIQIIVTRLELGRREDTENPEYGIYHSI